MCWEALEHWQNHQEHKQIQGARSNHRSQWSRQDHPTISELFPKSRVKKSARWCMNRAILRRPLYRTWRMWIGLHSRRPSARALASSGILSWKETRVMIRCPERVKANLCWPTNKLHQLSRKRLIKCMDAPTRTIAWIVKVKELTNSRRSRICQILRKWLAAANTYRRRQEEMPWRPPATSSSANPRATDQKW